MNKKLIIIITFLSSLLLSNIAVVINIFSRTFNFADNFGYARKLELLDYSIKSGTPFYIPYDTLFLNQDIKLVLISPALEFIGLLLLPLFDSIVIINIFIILNIFLSLLFAFKLFFKITNQKYILSCFGSVIFGASSLMLYSTWFNLVGVCLLPLILFYLIVIYEKEKIRLLDYIILFLVSLLIFLCSTYFVFLTFILYLSVFIVNLNKKNIGTSISLMFLFLLATGISFLIYKIPFIYFENYGLNMTMKEMALKSGISSSVDILRIFLPNNNNLFSKFQLITYRNLFGNSDINFFRYSIYIPLSLLVALIFGFQYNKGLIKRNNYFKLSIVIIFISFSLLVGESIIINGYNTNIPGPLAVIKQLPFGSILRKSMYFFFIMSLGFGLLICIIFNTKSYNKNIFIIGLLTIVTALSSLSPYNGSYFPILERKEIIYSLNQNNTILPLPNVGYNNSEYIYYLIKHNIGAKIIDYSNVTLKNYEKNLDYLTQDMNTLTFGIQLQNNAIGKDFSCDFGVIDTIVLFKSHIKHFFFYEKKSNNANRLAKVINKCTNIEKYYEDQDIIIFKK